MYNTVLCSVLNTLQSYAKVLGVLVFVCFFNFYGFCIIVSVKKKKKTILDFQALLF